MSDTEIRYLYYLVQRSWWERTIMYFRTILMAFNNIPPATYHQIIEIGPDDPRYSKGRVMPDYEIRRILSE